MSKRSKIQHITETVTSDLQESFSDAIRRCQTLGCSREEAERLVAHIMIGALLEEAVGTTLTKSLRTFFQ